MKPLNNFTCGNGNNHSIEVDKKLQLEIDKIVKESVDTNAKNIFLGILKMYELYMLYGKIDEVMLSDMTTDLQAFAKVYGVEL